MGILKDVKNAMTDAQNEMQGLKPRRGAKKGPSAAQIEARRIQGSEDVARWGPFALCCRRRAPAPQALRGDLIKQDLLGCQTTQDSERRPRRKGETEALATLPVELAVQLPEDYEPGMLVSMDGPHGRIEAAGPPDAKPGTTVRFRLAPQPDFQVEVPQGARAGTEVRLKRADGLEISVPVPKGLKPGDVFNIAPPALMVQVPQGCKPGDYVVFKEPGAGEQDWCRARVPEGTAPGGYFAARLPPPGEAKSKAGAKNPKLSTRAKGA
ncbi:unnamed protein product [Prorocentrum cordatum]|uniref:Chaperone DnaJ C-terminal domain-containing protein n=1 Tax=Prorocentrum cordatum TaxID=2364126 RepID=A0ABN9WQX4_9DINO|nr:unnamed protein product [Polarella glacialis]